MAEVLTPDLCVIGAGAAGIAATTEALSLGASVVVVEHRRPGGAVLQGGTIASKALVEAARHAHAMRTAAAFGIAAVEPQVDFTKLRNHIRDVLAGVAPPLSAERLTALGARVIPAEGRFIDRATLGAGDVLVKARRFLIATGATPVLPGIDGLADTAFFTTDTIFESNRRPTHLVIVGAGATGAELAQAYRRLGADVTLIEQGSPLAEADPELADIALRQLEQEGVLLRAGTTVPSVMPREGGGAVVTLATGDETESVSASHLLVAAGRAPDLDLDLDRADIRRSKTDPLRLALTPGLRTTNPRIYAIGDAAGGPQSSERAAYQARLVVRKALFSVPLRYRPELVPTAFYTDPEIAWVGVNEAQARERHGDRFQVARWSFASNDRARSRRQNQGLCKVVAAADGRVIGAGIVGPQAGELISLFSLAVANRITLKGFARFIAPYPTLSEIARLAAIEAGNNPLPSRLPSWLQQLGRMLP